jgi:hypothetical protein
MDGAKSVTDTIDNSKEFVVDRRFIWTEVFLRINMDQIKLRILAKVGS